MQVTIDYVKFKNLLSYGNTYTAVWLSKHKHTLITAKNAQGKCVHPSTKIEVAFADPDIQLKFEKFLTDSI